jgi:hypothetical protein
VVRCNKTVSGHGRRIARLLSERVRADYHIIAKLGCIVGRRAKFPFETFAWEELMGMVYDLFQIQTWGLTPAQIFFKRNSAGAAEVAINNIRVELANLAKLPGGGQIASDIQRVRNADDCMRLSNTLRGVAGNLPSREVAVLACDLGYGVGLAWSLCRPDHSKPQLWPQESQQAHNELGKATSAYQALCQKLPQMDKQLGFTMMSLQNDIINTNTPPYDVKLFDRFTSIIGTLQTGLQRSQQ